MASAGSEIPAKGLTLRIPLRVPLPDFGARFTIYITTLIVLVPFYSISDLASAAGGVYGAFVGISLLKYVREATFALILADFLVTSIVAGWREDTHRRVSPRGLALFGFFLLVVFAYSLRDYFINASPIGTIIVLRDLLIATISLVSFHVVRWYGADRVLTTLSTSCKILLLINIPVAIFELLTFPPVVGATMFGPRVYGTFPSPVIFSINLAAFFLVLSLRRSRNLPTWAALCVLLSMMSGGRTGLLGLLLLIGLHLSFRVFRDWRKGILVLLVGLLVAPLAMSLVSSRDISGRGIGGLSQEKRLIVWGDRWHEWVTRGDGTLLFGEYLGNGTNSARSIYKQFQNQFLEDSEQSDSTYIFYISSFGFIGLLIFVLPVPIFMFQRLSFDRVAIASLYLFLGIPVVIIEIHPANVILMTCFGMNAAIAAMKRSPGLTPY